MCEFFSILSNGKGKVFYADSEIRKKMKGTTFKPDSHTSIVQYFQDKGQLAKKVDTEDKLNKYEYNPLIKEFTVDQLNTKDDSEQVQKFCNKLDFKTIVPELIIKPIFHPFSRERKRVTQKDIQRLREWNSVWNSVGNSVGSSVGDSVRNSVVSSVWYSVWDSVWNNVGDSVGSSVWAYISSFFSLPKWKGIEHKEGANPFRCCIDLWESGLVPSFDGKIWRLHTGKEAKIVCEIKDSEL